MGASFRAYVPPPDHPRVAGLSELDAYTHAERALKIPWLNEVFAGWRQLYDEPFFGITTEGRKIPDLYSLASEGAPTGSMVEAAQKLIDHASPEQRVALCHPVDAHEWRAWSNPEIYVNKFGLRLDEIQSPVRDAVLDVMRASLSPKGYTKARNVLYMNQFLGEVVQAPRVLNQYSHNFNLFGTPSLSEPWGWNLYGHHLVLNVFVLAGQMVVSPVFLGAEPNEVDEGPMAGLKLFQDEELIGLELMRSLRSRYSVVRASMNRWRILRCRRADGTPPISVTWAARSRTTALFPTKACACPSSRLFNADGFWIWWLPISNTCPPDPSRHACRRSSST